MVRAGSCLPTSLASLTNLSPLAFGGSTGGNPFLLTQMARQPFKTRQSHGMATIQECSRGRAGAAPAPQLSLRISRLGRDCARAASAIALLGPSASNSRLEVLCGFTPDRTSQAIQRLYDDGLVQVQPRLSLRHPRLEKPPHTEHSDLSPVPSSTGTRLTSLTRRGNRLECGRHTCYARSNPAIDGSSTASVRQPTRPGVDRLRPLPRRTSDAHGKSHPRPNFGCPYCLSWRRPKQHAIRPEHRPDDRRALELSRDWRQRAHARVGFANCLSFGASSLRPRGFSRTHWQKFHRMRPSPAIRFSWRFLTRLVTTQRLA